MSKTYCSTNKIIRSCVSIDETQRGDNKEIQVDRFGIGSLDNQGIGSGSEYCIVESVPGCIAKIRKSSSDELFP